MLWMSVDIRRVREDSEGDYWRETRNQTLGLSRDERHVIESVRSRCPPISLTLFLIGVMAALHDIDSS